MFDMSLFIQNITPKHIPTPLPNRIDKYNKISTFLYLGNIDSLDDEDKFHLIVNCTRHISTATKCKETIRIPVDDHPSEITNMMNYIIKTNVLEKIHTCRMNKQHVLIHCHAGMQRSAAVLACYLIRFYKMTPEEAIRFIKHKRPIAFYPEANFMSVIQTEYYKSISLI
jgi:protein tyrosine/serine phosphatase